MNFLRLLKDNLSLGQDDDAPDRINYEVPCPSREPNRRQNQSAQALNFTQFLFTISSHTLQIAMLKAYEKSFQGLNMIV